MRINIVRNSVFLLCILFTGVMVAQEIESDSIVVVKSYTPSVRNAFKIKEKPGVTDTVNLIKKDVEYRFFSVPVASTFAPAKGRATSVEKERSPKVYENYVTLAFGSYTSVLAEFYSNLEINRTDNFGIFLTHNSAQGDIEGVSLDDQYYDTELNLNYASRQRDHTWNMDFGLEHQLYSWYGVDEDVLSTNPAIEPGHNFYSAYLGGELSLEDSFLDRTKARYRYFGDDFSSAEHRFTVKPTLELPIGGELLHTNVTMDVVSGRFSRNFFSEEELVYGFFNLGLDTSLLILREDLTLNLGAAVFYSLHSETNDSNFYVYPKITASYRVAGEYFIAYGGLEGGLIQNSYYEFAQENSFVAPTLAIQPTDRQSKAYVGAKGKLSDQVSFNIRGSYLSENFKPLFKAFPPEAPNDEPYAYGNSFGIVYDQVNTLSAFGELGVAVNNSLDLRLNGEYFVYQTDQEEEAWNLPDFRANLMADYQITESWFAGANVFFVGQRKDLSYDNGLTPTVATLESYLDLNLNAGYRFNDRLSIFARGSNLLGDNYEKWNGYPVLGLQLMAGATYKFDFGR